MIPTDDDNWAECKRTYIDVRRSMVLVDGLREAKKLRFDPTKLLSVRL